MSMNPQPQYGGSPVPPPPAPGSSKWGPSSLGMDPHLAAGLGYLIPLVGLIFFFIEKTNRYIRFHNAQAILLALTGIVLSIVDNILTYALFAGSAATSGASESASAAASLGGAAILTCVFGLLYLGLIALWIWAIIAGFTGKVVKFPVIGGIAEKWAGGPVVPVF